MKEVRTPFRQASKVRGVVKKELRLRGFAERPGSLPGHSAEPAFPDHQRPEASLSKLNAVSEAHRLLNDTSPASAL